MGTCKVIWRREWQPTPVFLPRKRHGQSSLAGCSLWGPKELDWRRKWQPTSAFLLEKSHGQWNLAVHGVAKTQSQLNMHAHTCTSLGCWDSNPNSITFWLCGAESFFTISVLQHSFLQNCTDNNKDIIEHSDY